MGISFRLKTLSKKSSNNHHISSGNNGFVELSSSFCNVDWHCTGWSECSSGLITRSCEDANHCNLEYNKPIEKTACDVKNVLVEEKKPGTSVGIWLIIALLILALIVIAINWNEI
ncbi:hypothetical protein HY212_06390 [Candidatus Pacearchaeota archaeon]|nr:hypothetical protein [Candidatus Pacearchaeota archaeon]